MAEYLFNLSGHPAPKGAEEIFEKVVSVPVPNVDLGSETAVAEAAKTLVKSALGVDAFATMDLLHGKGAVILPGASALAGAVLAVLVGFSGTLPELRWAARTEDGFVLSQGLDLAQLRLEGRAWREEAEA